MPKFLWIFVMELHLLFGRMSLFLEDQKEGETQTHASSTSNFILLFHIKNPFFWRGVNYLEWTREREWTIRIVSSNCRNNNSNVRKCLKNHKKFFFLSPGSIRDLFKPENDECISLASGCSKNKKFYDSIKFFLDFTIIVLGTLKSDTIRAEDFISQ